MADFLLQRIERGPDKKGVHKICPVKKSLRMPVIAMALIVIVCMVDINNSEYQKKNKKRIVTKSIKRFNRHQRGKGEFEQQQQQDACHNNYYQVMNNQAVC